MSQVAVAEPDETLDPAPRLELSRAQMNVVFVTILLGLLLSALSRMDQHTSAWVEARGVGADVGDAEPAVAGGGQRDADVADRGAGQRDDGELAGAGGGGDGGVPGHAVGAGGDRVTARVSTAAGDRLTGR
jgi:hypothetical protein